MNSLGLGTSVGDAPTGSAANITSTAIIPAWVPKRFRPFSQLGEEMSFTGWRGREQPPQDSPNGLGGLAGPGGMKRRLTE
jgi:hypothetical protein